MLMTDCLSLATPWADSRSTGRRSKYMHLHRLALFGHSVESGSSNRIMRPIKGKLDVNQQGH